MDHVEELVRSAQKGDRAALEQLLQHHEADVLRFARHLCHSPDDADEAAQHALLTIFSHIGSFRGAARFTTWLFTIVRRECERRLRLRPRNVPLPEHIVYAPADDDDAHVRAHLLRAVAEGLAGLDRETRTVLLLRDVNGLGNAEAAKCMGITVAACKSRLLRAREELRATLRRSGFKPNGPV